MDGPKLAQGVVTTERYVRRETIIRKPERRGKAKAKFQEEERQKHISRDNPET